MSKKIIFATIALQRKDQLKKLAYHRENTQQCYPIASAFPAIPVMEESLCDGDDVTIIPIITEDTFGNSRNNLEVFQEELAEMNQRHGWQLQLSDPIIIPHEETKPKQVQLFREFCNRYEENAEIYMDVTYGTKVTAIGVFSTLVYAERVKNCNIRSIIYGKFLHDAENTGEIYDIRPLYNLNMLIGALDPGCGDVNALLNALWR